MVVDLYRMLTKAGAVKPDPMARFEKVGPGARGRGRSEGSRGGGERMDGWTREAPPTNERGSRVSAERRDRAP